MVERKIKQNKLIDNENFQHFSLLGWKVLSKFGYILKKLTETNIK